MEKLITVVMPCYNEEKNIEEAYTQVKGAFAKLPGYRYEHIFIDNSSEDRTVQILREIARRDKNVKVILNSRNFGHIRSPFYGLLQARGDAAILMSSDLQDPPALIPRFIKRWEEGYRIVLGVKNKSEENQVVFTMRRLYYALVNALSEVEFVNNFTGFGLYDRKVVDILRETGDPYPYMRGLICDIGFEKAQVEFTQPRRNKGATKNNIYTLYDMAMLGMSSYSKVPLRLAVMTGFTLSMLSLAVAAVYFGYKLLYWNSFSVGIAPLIIGLFFFSSVQLLFLGIIGEYIGMIYTQVQGRPLVIEKERINFD
jgi:polyisoprenyl-phosphate glycosyltransferase